MGKVTAPDVVIVALQERINQLFDEIKEHAEELAKTREEARQWENGLRQYIAEAMEVAAYVDAVGDEEMDSCVESTRERLAGINLLASLNILTSEQEGDQS